MAAARNAKRTRTRTRSKGAPVGGVARGGPVSPAYTIRRESDGTWTVAVLTPAIDSTFRGTVFGARYFFRSLAAALKYVREVAQ